MARRGKPAQQEVTAQERVKRHLVQRLYVRFHMFLILGTAGLTGMLVSGLLLKLGVAQMTVRYPIAILCAYAAFLLCVGLWLRYVARVRREPAQPASLDGGTPADVLDVVDVVDAASNLPGSVSGGGRVGGSGGQFGGGGASGTWSDSAPQQGFIAQPGGGSSGKGLGFDFDFDLDGDGLVVLILAIAVIAGVAFASGYLVWFAPDILAEAVVGAALAGGLAKSARREDAGGWMMGVIRKTWWPFAVVLVMCVLFAGFAQSAYPGVRTAKEALARATQPASDAPATPVPPTPPAR